MGRDGSQGDNSNSNKEGNEMKCEHKIIHRIKQTEEVFCLSCKTKLGEISHELWKNDYKKVMNILEDKNAAEIEA